MEIIKSEDITVENEHGARVLKYAEKNNYLIDFYIKDDFPVKNKIFLMLCFNGYIKSIQNILTLIEPEMKNHIINITDRLKRTAFHLSCMQGHGKVISVLIDERVYINCEDRIGCLPVHYACIYGHLDIIRLLKNHDEDMSIMISDTSELYKAVAEGNIEKVKSLHSLGCDLNLKHSGNVTALHVAASRGHVDIVKYLIQKGADKSAENYVGFTPLHGAVFTNSAAVKYLMHNANSDYMKKYASSLFKLIEKFPQKDYYNLLQKQIQSFTANKTTEDVKKFIGAAEVHETALTKRKYELRSSSPAKRIKLIMDPDT